MGQTMAGTVKRLASVIGGVVASVVLGGCVPGLVGSGLVYVSDLDKLRVEILPQAEVQSRCASLGVGRFPQAASALPSATLGCAGWERGKAVVYSIDSTGVLLHELEHAVNKKWCHTSDNRPDYCRNWGQRP